MTVEGSSDMAARVRRALRAVGEDEIGEVARVKALRLLDELVDDVAYKVGEVSVVGFKEAKHAHLGDAGLGEGLAERDARELVDSARHRRDDDDPARLQGDTESAVAREVLVEDVDRDAIEGRGRRGWIGAPKSGERAGIGLGEDVVERCDGAVTRRLRGLFSDGCGGLVHAVSPWAGAAWAEGEVASGKASLKCLWAAP